MLNRPNINFNLTDFINTDICLAVPYQTTITTEIYQHLVSGVPLGCALGNSLDLMLVFPCTPLLLLRYRHSTVHCSAVECRTVQYSIVQCWLLVLICQLTELLSLHCHCHALTGNISFSPRHAKFKGEENMFYHNPIKKIRFRNCVRSPCPTWHYLQNKLNSQQIVVPISILFSM